MVARSIVFISKSKQCVSVYITMFVVFMLKFMEYHEACEQDQNTEVRQRLE